VVIGETLGMKPLVSVVNGTVQSIGKARGMQAALQAIIQQILADPPDLRYGMAFTHSFAWELLDKLIVRLNESFELTDKIICDVGSVIGTYAGKGAVGIAYIAK
jgi:fatty acid-binding protein DegV